MSITQALKPCPFCGSTDLCEGETMYLDADRDRSGVECMNCDALARKARWNQRDTEALQTERAQGERWFGLLRYTQEFWRRWR